MTDHADRELDDLWCSHKDGWTAEAKRVKVIKEKVREDFLVLLKLKGNQELLAIDVTRYCNMANFCSCLLLILFRQSQSSGYIQNLAEQNSSIEIYLHILWNLCTRFNDICFLSV